MRAYTHTHNAGRKVGTKAGREAGRERGRKGGWSGGREKWKGKVARKGQRRRKSGSAHQKNEFTVTVRPASIWLTRQVTVEVWLGHEKMNKSRNSINSRKMDSKW